MNAGQRVTLRVTAHGSAPFSYQWSKDGTRIAGATGPSYSIVAVGAAHAGEYTVQVANAAGRATAPAAVIKVGKASEAAAAPKITQQPASVSVSSGGSVTLTVRAAGPGLKYQWRKNGIALSGATSATLTLDAVSSATAGTYSVVVSNSAGAVTSSGATLTVVASIAAPWISRQPQSQSVAVGQVAKFDVTVSGTPPFCYQWRKDGVDIKGATGSSYTIAGVTAASGGTYSVVVSNRARSVPSTNAVLTVAGAAPAAAPTIQQQPASSTVRVGQSATFSVTATGAGLAYQWRKNGVAIAGATGSSYTIASTTAASGGTYSVVVTSKSRSVTSSSATLTVQSSVTGLVAAYSFNEGSGATVADRSGHGNQGTVLNAVWTTSGKFKSALSFNGTNARVWIYDSNSLDLTNGMTLEAWVYPTALGGWRDVIYKSTDLYYLMGSSHGSNRPAAGGTFASGEVFGPSPLRLNTWTHLATTYDGAHLRLYVNGLQVASRAQTGSVRRSGLPLSIGGDATFGQYWAGRIDEVRVYNRPLSASEIQTDMKTGISP